jgi:hypothetical protein
VTFASGDQGCFSFRYRVRLHSTILYHSLFRKLLNCRLCTNLNVGSYSVYMNLLFAAHHPSVRTHAVYAQLIVPELTRTTEQELHPLIRWLINYYYYYYYYYYYCSTAYCWVLAAFLVSWSYTQSVGFRGRGGSACRKTTIYTQNNTNTE